MKNTPFKLGVLYLLLALLTLSYSCDKEEVVYNITTVERPQRKVGYSGNDITPYVTITRDKTTRNAIITVAEDGPWEIYAGTTPSEINMKKPVLTGDLKGTYSVSVGDTCRVYFHVEFQNMKEKEDEKVKGSAIMAERVLPMGGAYNFRDLGGYKTTDGRHVKWGKILRSENLASLNAKDLEYLKNLPLVSVADLRGVGEGAADKLPATVQNQYKFPMTEFTGTGQYGGLYKVLVTEEVHLARYRQLFEYLMDENNVPLVFHCSAGKDRTGVTAALILIALGVEEETIFQDFMMTNTCFAGTPSAGWTVDRSWIQDTFNTLNSAYPSTDSFFTETLGVDLEAFREMYLE